MELMTRKEVAEYLKVCQRTADTLINDKYFEGKMQIGRRVLVVKEKLDEYIKNNI